MRKRTSHAFGKKVYLMGKDINGSILWLEEPSWDCGWYWGFGYLEEYTNTKRPDLAKDIQMHTHVDSHLFKILKSRHLIKEQEGNIFFAFSEPAFTEKEGQQLTAYFKEFYRVKEGANDYINQEVIPEITKNIIEILKP